MGRRLVRLVVGNGIGGLLHRRQRRHRADGIREHQAETGGAHREGPDCDVATGGDLHAESAAADDRGDEEASRSLQGLPLHGQADGHVVLPRVPLSGPPRAREGTRQGECRAAHGRSSDATLHAQVRIPGGFCG